jgi:predicted nuclease of predicted toxin-antitoxin system
MARHEQQIVISRDADFVDAFLLRGEPPQLLWGTAGNLSNDELMRLLWLAAQFAGRLRAAKLAELTADDLIIHP